MLWKANYKESYLLTIYNNMQSKKYSLIESVTNTAIGFMISLLIQIVIYPVMGIPVTFSQNIIITMVFTLVSILRGYVIRRIFNLINKKL